MFVFIQHDLIYTFFHPMLRDEQDFDKTNVLKLRGLFSPSFYLMFILQCFEGHPASKMYFHNTSSSVNF